MLGSVFQGVRQRLLAIGEFLANNFPPFPLHCRYLGLFFISLNNFHFTKNGPGTWVLGPDGSSNLKNITRVHVQAHNLKYWQFSCKEGWNLIDRFSKHVFEEQCVYNDVPPWHLIKPPKSLDCSNIFLDGSFREQHKTETVSRKILLQCLWWTAHTKLKLTAHWCVSSAFLLSPFVAVVGGGVDVGVLVLVVGGAPGVWQWWWRLFAKLKTPWCVSFLALS